MEILKTALTAIITHKLRSFLTILGIVIGVSAVILLVSIGSGLSSYVTKQFEELGTDPLIIAPGNQSPGSRGGREGGAPGAASNKLLIRDSEEIRKKAKLIVDTLPISSNSITVSYKKEEKIIPILGSTEGYATIRKSPTKYGKFFSSTSVEGSKKEAVIGVTVIKDLNLPENPVTQTIKIGGQSFKIVGVLEEKGASFGSDQDNLILIPITTFKRIFNIDRVTYIYAKIQDPDQMENAKKEVEKILLKRLKKEEFSIFDPKELLQTVSSILGAVTTALAGIAAISLVVGGIGIANIMLVSVTERTKEIGLRKAVGARGKDILFQFLLEALVLSISGGTIGILLGIGFSALLNSFIQTEISIWSVFTAFSVSCLVGIVSGMGPAIKAARKNPIVALRYE